MGPFKRASKQYGSGIIQAHTKCSKNNLVCRPSFSPYCQAVGFDMRLRLAVVKLSSMVGFFNKLISNSFLVLKLFLVLSW